MKGLPIFDQVMSWLDELHYYEARSRLWKRAAKEHRTWELYFQDRAKRWQHLAEVQTMTATRREEWATVWKQRAHLDNMRAFQWRQLATKRKEWLVRTGRALEYCPFCGESVHMNYGHADDCELAKELEE